MQFDVDKMTCGHCVRAITSAIQKIDTAARVDVDLVQKRVSVQSSLSAQDVIAALGAVGYPARPR